MKKTRITEHTTRIFLIVFALLVLIGTMASLYLTHSRIERNLDGHRFIMETDPKTGKQIRVIYAEPCEHQINIEDCLTK